MATKNHNFADIFIKEPLCTQGGLVLKKKIIKPTKFLEKKNKNHEEFFLNFCL